MEQTVAGGAGNYVVEVEKTMQTGGKDGRTKPLETFRNPAKSKEYMATCFMHSGASSIFTASVYAHVYICQCPVSIIYGRDRIMIISVMKNEYSLPAVRK